MSIIVQQRGYTMSIGLLVAIVSDGLGPLIIHALGASMVDHEVPGR